MIKKKENNRKRATVSSFRHLGLGEEKVRLRRRDGVSFIGNQIQDSEG